MGIFGFGLFFGSVLWYTGLFIVIVAVAIAGVFVGKKLREKKDAKEKTFALFCYLCLGSKRTARLLGSLRGISCAPPAQGLLLCTRCQAASTLRCRC